MSQNEATNPSISISNGCILIMFPNKFVAAIIRSSLLVSWNLKIASSIYLSIWPAGAKNMIAWKCWWLFIFPHQESFLSSIIKSCVCLIISTLSGRPNVSCREFHAFIQFIICLQKLLALFGRVPSWNKFNLSLKENLASGFPSKTYVPYTNITLRPIVNSSVC